MKKNNRFLLTFVFVVTFIVFISDVKAFDYDNDVGRNGTQVCFNKSTGVYTTKWLYARDGGDSVNDCTANGYGWDAIKLIKGEYAFCINYDRFLNHDDSWETVSNWNVKYTEHSIKTGYIMDEISSRGYSKEAAYTLQAAALNAYFARYVPDYRQGSINYNTSDINNIINNAIKKYKNEYTLSKKVPNAKFDVGNMMMLQVGTSDLDFISDKITVKNLYKSYGGAPVTYTLSASVVNSSNADIGNATICSKQNATDCKNSVTISSNNISSSGTYSFYIKATKQDISNSLVRIYIKVNEGGNVSSYPSSILYENTQYKSKWQRLLTKGPKTSVSRTMSTFTLLMLPDTTKYNIGVAKFDENGSPLTGATLELYRGNPEKSGATLLKTESSSWILAYEVENKTAFTNYDYYLVEKSAPDGYVLNTSPILVHSAGDNSWENCYNSNGEKVDSSLCKNTYKYQCKNENGFSDPGDNNTCADGEELICYNSSASVVADDISYCSDSYTLVFNSANQVYGKHHNKKNMINISKMNATGKKEVAGAELKICTVSDYKSNGINCTAAKTIDDVIMEWVSGTSHKTFNGIKVGSYVIIEVTPPSGYIKATSVTEFSIDKFGNVKAGNDTFSYDDFTNGDVVVIANKINNLKISKQDVATSKELPGATISICETYEEDGKINILKKKDSDDCIVTILSDNSEATWVSTNESHSIEGLSAGTYALVEKIAPKGYETAESIIFTMKDDGTLTDKDGNSIKDKKLVMKDKKIEEVKTGSLSLYIVIGTVVVVAALGLGSYYYMKKKSVISTEQSKKIRKRKIHKK